ncbi:transporter substrate-binding domain-containing protein [Microbulbifer sp. SH-1]|uniref:transporter substrate-binding domain-containing protein n=1 Tax=Microbulbifer sp. SH-1 TaxID=2681547 RepID=UPI001409E100|nr:transporter substrate-binding domain-containing protein [Microbulbifer sp. SH-1]QIL88703.1 transporter substrate-binding domain-containing protein [Microbulbifer sp. SH-1]
MSFSILKGWGIVTFFRLLSFLLFFSFFAACDQIPKDPHDTLEKVLRDKRIRVGVIHNPPWTDIRSDVPRGLEIELVQQFASELGASPKWSIVDVDSAMQQLQRGELDIVVGGLLKSSPYREVGFTRPYVEFTPEEGEQRAQVMAVRRGENRWLVTLERFLKGASFRIQPGPTS